MRWTLPACCARAASGHAAAPPTSVMNSRRLIVAPRGQNDAPHRLTAVRVLERDERGANCDQLFSAGNVGFEPHYRGQNRKSSKSANVFRFAPERWGNRPASLWIAGRFGVLRFRLMVKRGPHLPCHRRCTGPLQELQGGRGGVWTNTLQASIRRERANRRDITVRRRDDADDALRSGPKHAGACGEVVL